MSNYYYDNQGKLCYNRWVEVVPNRKVCLVYRENNQGTFELDNTEPNHQS
ncbi:hypothetical protein [Gloeothece verrucosa]|uniref:Uncharacterized protein n=1 Tax=Gloeothece verrucosa (strain PCC 7822) TaxID=497965 RepID=E0ULA8_GLOV7|nr:hypothetical protein [Gloeothece verrucosa]ADN17738.1 hypothetical protein Cyan7822_5884 [Gloeothece verrucosa PCC 7822]